MYLKDVKKMTLDDIVTKFGRGGRAKAAAKVRPVNDAEAVGRAAAARAAANAAVIERLQARNVAARGAK